MTLSRLRDSVRRDLTWLLNAVGLEAVQDLSAHEEVQRSTLNFGIPDVTGRAVSTIDRAALASKIRRAICDFEPRLLRHSVSVRPTTSQGSGPSTLCFSIEAELWAQPTPLHLLFQTELNLESGDARVTDDRTE
jgi:type VI secretion system protein ImpF